MATIDVKDAAGSTVAIEKPLAPGRAAPASSRPVALSTEDLAAIEAITAKLIAAPATAANQATEITALTTIAGHVDGIETLIGATNTALTTIDGRIDGLESLTGALTETAPATDTASSGLNGRLQRIAQRLTTLLGAGATTIAKAEDVASADADVGVPAMAVRKATPANTSGTDGDYEMLQMSAGRLWVSAILEAGSALLGRMVADASAAAGGIASTSRIVSAAASTNGTSAKGSAGRLYAIQGYNAAAAVRYIKLYNKATAPTVGTDTPVKTLAIPPGVGFAFDWPHGYSFATGIAYALTTGSADADTGALTAGDILGLNVDYV